MVIVSYYKFQGIHEDSAPIAVFKRNCWGNPAATIGAQPINNHSGLAIWSQNRTKDLKFEIIDLRKSEKGEISEIKVMNTIHQKYKV